MVPQPLTDETIKKYFNEHKSYKVILLYLKHDHGIRVSHVNNNYTLTWLKRRLRFLGLHRKGSRVKWDATDLVYQCVEMEIIAGHYLRGYRAIWDILHKDYGLRVKRKSVMRMLQVLDPSGALECRQRRLKRRAYCYKGPNHIWHLDGNDKLKKFGFSLHACIDGFSRKILWLCLTPTNNDPRVIVSYYLNAVAMFNGCPLVVRSDYGTENCYVAACQIAFRSNDSRSYLYGKSTTNTRIEGWWSVLKKFKLSWWIEHLEALIYQGSFNPNDSTHKYCLAYCYAHILEEELSDFQTEWNTHRMRKSYGSRCPSGVPNDLYNLPDLTGAENCLCSDVDGELFVRAWLEYAAGTPTFYPSCFKEVLDDYLLSTLAMEHHSITLNNAAAVYRHLVTLL